jgi:hypothetical protein
MATKRQIFYSFHYDNDVFRVQQIRNMGALEENKPVSPNEWETVKKGGDTAIEKWIDNTMKIRSCVVVLIGEETHNRKWVKHEIKKAWADDKGLLGIYIHNLKDPKTGKCSKGTNPFEQFTFKDGTKLSSKVSTYNPDTADAYNDIKNNIEKWVEKAIKDRE